jgi:fibronectin-binding autotransporter adhesin
MGMRGSFRSLAIAGLGTTAALLLSPWPSFAQTTNWTGGTGSWFTAGNWNNGVPGAIDTATVGNGGTAQVNAGASVQTLNISGGSTVDLQTGGSLTASNGIFVGGGPSAGALVLSGSSNLSGAITLANAVITSNATGTLSNSIAAVPGYSASIDVTAGSTLTLTGPISGGALVITGSGTTVFAGNNSSINGTFVRPGATLQMGNGGTSGAIGTGTVTNDGALIFNRSDSFIIANVFGGAGTIDIASGTMIYTGTSNDSGLLTIASGATLQLGNGITNGTLSGLESVVNNGTLIYNSVGISDNPISGTGSLIKAGSGAVALRGANTYSGGTTITGGTLLLVSSGSAGTGAITLGGSGFVDLDYADLINVANSIVIGNGAAQLSLANGGLATQAGVISETNGSQSLVISGSGTLILSGNNTYAGGTNIKSGTVQVSADQNLGNSNGAITVGNNGVLKFGAAFNPNSSRAILVNAVQGASGIINTNGFDITLAQGIGGTGDFTKTGAGTLTLNGASSYSGTTNVSQGVLKLGIDNALPSNLLIINGGGMGTLDLNNHNQIVGGLSGAGSIALGSGTLTINGGGTAWDGTISGTGGLIKTGSGSIVLSNTNTYSGSTTVSAGTLHVPGSIGSSAATVQSGGRLIAQGAVGAVTIQSGGALIGLGTVGPVTVQNGGRLAPGNPLVAPDSGNSVGALTINGNLVLAPGATYSAEAGFSSTSGWTFAKTSISGTASIAGNLSLDYPGNSYTPAGLYTLISSSGALSGTFSGVSAPALAGSGFHIGGVSYDVHDVYLSIARDTFVWSATPVSRDWNTNANWQNGAVPQFDVAHFGATNQPDISIGPFTGSATSLVFEAGAPAYSFTIANPGSTPVPPNFVYVPPSPCIGTCVVNAPTEVVNLDAGIVDNSSNPPSFLVGGVFDPSILNFVSSGNAADASITAAAFGSVIFKGSTDAGPSAKLVTLSGGFFDFSQTPGPNGDHKVSAGSIAGAGYFVLGSNNLTVGALNTSTEVGGIISGINGSLTKVGTGTLTLSGANTYTGGTTITAGVLRLGTGGSLASTGALSLGGGTFDLNGNAQTIGGLTNANFSLNNELAINGGTLTVNQATDSVFSAKITGSGSFIYNGPAGLTVGGPGTNFSGSITVNGGILTPITGFGGGTLTINSGGTLSVFHRTLTFGTLSGTGGTLNMGGSFLTFTSAANSTFAGVITDSSGQFTKGGSGTLILTGASTAVSDLVISGGTLQFGNGGTAGGFNYRTLTDNGAFVVNRSDAVAFAGVISGTGTVTQAGGGALTLSGTNTYTGATSVTAGTLNVTGRVAGVGVASGATLTGNGTVGSTTIASGGTLTPGNGSGPGTLSVSGNLSLASGATYVDAVTPTATNLTSVSGAASVNGNFTASFASGTYTVGQRYTVLTASSGVSGTFATVSSSGSPTYVKPRLSYDANNVYLNLDPNALAPMASNPTGNQNSGLTAIDQAVASGAGPSTGFAALYGLSGAALNAATDQISGQIGSNVANATGQGFLSFMTMTAPGGSSGSSFAPGSAYGTQDAPRRAQLGTGETRVWGAVYGGHVGLSSDTASGAAGLSASNVGMIAGADLQLGEDFLVGATAGFGRQDFRSGNGTGNSDDVMVGLYARKDAGRFYVTAAFGLGWHQITTQRIITVSGTDVLQGKEDATDFGGRAEAGWRMNTHSSYAVSPYVAIAAESFETPAYAETALSGASTFALSYASHTSTLGRSELGAHLDRDFGMDDGTLSAGVRAAWAHRLGDAPFTQATFQALPGASFVVRGVRPDSDTALLGVNLDVKKASGLFFGVNGETQLGARTTILQGMGSLGWRW